MKLKILRLGIAAGIAAYVGVTFVHEATSDEKFNVNAASNPPPIRKLTNNSRSLPSRSEQLEKLKTCESFDVLIIGGGATGTGCALDAVTRGLKTALVEADDFASKTSSRSTKLLHGGVSYLYTAITQFDKEQFQTVKDSLQERANIINNSPNLTKVTPIVIPIYSWWKLPLYWFGLKLYDAIAGMNYLKLSHYVSKEKALEMLPVLKEKDLCGGVVYYDGIHDDARMNLSLAMTAARYGANVANYVEVLELVKNTNGKICGVRVRDNTTDDVFDIKAKCVINATGPYSDAIRKMDDSNASNICITRCGTHIVMPGYITSNQCAIFCVPNNESKVFFVMPWERHTLVGTTDDICDPKLNPSPSETEIQILLNGLRDYLSPDVQLRREDVLSAWSGIQPLVSSSGSKKGMKTLSQNHTVEVSKSNLITIVGGKWTTYRVMASDTIDKAISLHGLKPRRKNSQTASIKLDGGHDWTPTFYITLVQSYNLEEDIAKHLSEKYGTRAYDVLSHCGCKTPSPDSFKRLHSDFPYTEHEIRYCIREYATTAVDMIARRTRLAFLNTEAALQILPTIVNIMGEELNWDPTEREAQFNKAKTFIINEMGHCNVEASAASKAKKDANWQRTKENYYKIRFKRLDGGGRGYVRMSEVFHEMKRLSHGQISDEMLLQIMKQVNSRRNGRYDVKEFTRLMFVLELYMDKEKHAKEV